MLNAAKNIDAVQIDRLIALRNWAAHESPQSARKAKAAIGQKRAHSAGSWVKANGRLEALMGAVENFARDIQKSAPY